MAFQINSRPAAFYKMQTFEAEHPVEGSVSLRVAILSPRYNLANLGVAIEEVLMPVVRRIQPFGQHYDNYSVSSGVLSTKTIDDKQRLVLTTGNNVKLQEGICPWKVCSEEVSIGTAELFEVDKIWAIGVAAVRKIDDESGISRPQLPPCGDCRTRLYDNVLIDMQTQFVLENTAGEQELLDLQVIKTRFGYISDLSIAA